MSRIRPRRPLARGPVATPVHGQGTGLREIEALAGLP